MSLISEVHQCAKSFFHFKHNICTMPAVTSGWASFWHILLSAESYHSVSAVTAFYINLDLIHKHGRLTPTFFYLVLFVVILPLIQRKKNLYHLKEQTFQ